MALKTISYSFLHLLACPYASFLRYQAAIKGPTTPWLALGNSVHFALEEGHKNEVFSIENAIKLFVDEFQRIIDDEEVFIGWPQHRKLETEGKEMLGVYNAQLQAGEIPSKPLVVEEEFRIPFLGIEVVGRIDRIDQLSSGGLSIADYKSGKTKPDAWFLRHDPQLTAYAWACLQKRGELPEEVVWWHLRTGERLSTVRTMQDIKELEDMIRNAIWMNERGVRHRVFHDKVCGQCDYSGFAKMGGFRPTNPICDDHELELQTLERLGLK